MMTQKQMVMGYLQINDRMTQKDAYEEFGITKLATVVSELILEDGEPIVKEWVRGKNRYGKPTRYKAYRLEK